MRHPIRLLTSVLVLLVYFNNCAPFEEGQGGPAYDMSKLNSGSSMEQRALGVLAANCSNCHNATTNNGGVPDILNVGALVQAGFIIPGNPDMSALIFAVDQNRMPPNQPLNSTDRQVLREWVAGNQSGTVLAAGTTATAADTITQLPSSGGGTGTGTAVTPPPSDPTTFRAIQQDILIPKCVSCHNANNRNGGYAFDTYASTLKAVTAKNPGRSILYTDCQKGKMPLAGTLLTSAQLSNLSQWITKGALNN